MNRRTLLGSIAALFAIPFGVKAQTPTPKLGPRYPLATLPHLDDERFKECCRNIADKIFEGRDPEKTWNLVSMEMSRAYWRRRVENTYGSVEGAQIDGQWRRFIEGKA